MSNTIFEHRPCAAGCGNGAISGSELCALHCADRASESNRLVNHILSKTQVSGLSAAYLKYENITFIRREFYGCNFFNAEFVSCTFTECNMRLDFFDFATFTNCKFVKSDMRSVSFGGSSLDHCLFEDSELLHINFCGAKINDTLFCHSNLYNSRFNNSKIKGGVDMAKGLEINDCNVKKVFFINVNQDDIKFKSSNSAEAVFFMES
jgi:uncharacterized protein YjbI with pentapeptide repeats